ncbi:MAG TPA: hypothetical protein VLJ68_11090 [Chitinophagaceae bacterium]|nr:hypothetical protein [Chitinophagaceae bacterium]
MTRNRFFPQLALAGAFEADIPFVDLDRLFEVVDVDELDVKLVV